MYVCMRTWMDVCCPSAVVGCLGVWRCGVVGLGVLGLTVYLCSALLHVVATPDE